MKRVRHCGQLLKHAMVERQILFQLAEFVHVCTSAARSACSVQEEYAVYQAIIDGAD